MIEYIKHKRKLSQLFDSKEKIRLQFKRKVESARKEGKSAEDLKRIDYDGWFEQQLLDEEISIITTNRIIHKAQRHFVPLPMIEEEGMWAKLEYTENR